MVKEHNGFYGHFLTEALTEGGSVEASGGEIAELRRRLAKALRRRPDDLRLLVQGATVLARAAAMEHRMTPRAEKGLADSFAAVLKDLGDQLTPA